MSVTTGPAGAGCLVDGHGADLRLALGSSSAIGFLPGMVSTMRMGHQRLSERARSLARPTICEALHARGGLDFIAGDHWARRGRHHAHFPRQSPFGFFSMRRLVISSDSGGPASWRGRPDPTKSSLGGGVSDGSENNGAWRSATRACSWAPPSPGARDDGDVLLLLSARCAGLLALAQPGSAKSAGPPPCHGGSGRRCAGLQTFSQGFGQRIIQRSATPGHARDQAAVPATRRPRKPRCFMARTRWQPSRHPVTGQVRLKLVQARPFQACSWTPSGEWPQPPGAGPQAGRRRMSWASIRLAKPQQRGGLRHGAARCPDRHQPPATASQQESSIPPRDGRSHPSQC